MIVVFGRRSTLFALVYLFTCVVSIRYDGEKEKTLYVAGDSKQSPGTYFIDRVEDNSHQGRRKRDAATSAPAALHKNISTWVTVHFLIKFNHSPLLF